jgi:hypothetical protein
LTGKCKYCQKPIYWQNVTGLWIPFEDAGLQIRHNCTKRVEIVKAGYLPPPPEGAPVSKKPGPVEQFTPQESVALKRFARFLVEA